MKVKQIAILLIVILLPCLAASGCGAFGHDPSEDVKPHLIALSEAETNPVRPIGEEKHTQGFTATSDDEQYDELLAIVYGGARPDFTDALPEVREVYNLAIDVLDRYILNDFTDFERVHAIHDYLTYYVRYDFDLYESGASASSRNPGFGLKGVFKNKKAVCDGFAKAFALMCGIERIPCIRVTGQYNYNGANINHAWNKVQLDGVWYNVDTTMDICHVETDAKTRVAILNHGYFLLSDADMRSTPCGRHTQSGTDEVNYACPQTYDFHKTQSLGIGPYTMEITSQEELNDIFSRIKKSKGKIGKAELKLNFPEYAPENLSRVDAYVSQISEAYKKVPDTDFLFDASRGVYPYQRYPGGVFVFLIYK